MDLADQVARHLVMVARLLDEDPELAYRHARAVRDRASRVAVAREAAGLAAYRVGLFADALSELRAFTRMTGSHQHLPVMADCERGLGRPEKALTMAGSEAASALDTEGRVEMRIVASGARRDLGQLDAAVVTLHCPELNSRGQQPWLARLRYAYADALLAAGREDEARTWFGRTIEIDADGFTDAAERLDEMDGVQYLTDVDDDEAPETGADEVSDDAEALHSDGVVD